MQAIKIPVLWISSNRYIRTVVVGMMADLLFPVLSSGADATGLDWSHPPAAWLGSPRIGSPFLSIWPYSFGHVILYTA